MNLRPIGRNVLIRPHVEPEQTESGLHVVRHWPQENSGEVVAVATTRIMACQACGGIGVPSPGPVKVGDTVVFPSEAGQDIRVDDERFVLMPDTDILAVLEVPHV